MYNIVYVYEYLALTLCEARQSADTMFDIFSYYTTILVPCIFNDTYRQVEKGSAAAKAMTLRFNPE